MNRIKLSTENKPKRINKFFIFAFIAFTVAIIFVSIYCSFYKSSDVNQQDENGLTQFMKALSSLDKSDENMRYLRQTVSKNIDVSRADFDGKTTLMYAVFYGDIEILELIISKGVDVNSVDNSGRSALHWAAYYGEFDAAVVLIKQNCKIELKDKYNLTAFDVAQFEGFDEIATLILNSKTE